MANEKRIEVESGALFVDGGHATPLLMEQADALRAEIALADAAREALGDVELADLPEGVRLRLTLDPQVECPEGWEWRTQVAWRSDCVAWCPVEVRPIPAPKTERVPWHEAKGRFSVAVEATIIGVGDGFHGPWVSISGVAGERLVSVVNPDGTVEVLVEGDES